MPHPQIARPTTFALAALLSLAPAPLAQNSGELPDAPGILTVDNQAQYANIVLADKRPVMMPQDNQQDNYYTRRLRQQFKMPIKYTWDAGALKFLTDNNILLMHFIEDFSSDLVGTLGSGQGPYLLGPLGKIKEIHLTTTTKRWSSNPDITGDGLYPAFNKSSGVLTMALSSTQGVNRNVNGGLLSAWITANVK